MTIQMTIRVDDDLATFVDEAVNEGEGSRADIINRAIRREVRRRRAETDAQIYALSADRDRDEWVEVTRMSAAAVLADLD